MKSVFFYVSESKQKCLKENVFYMCIKHGLYYFVVCKKKINFSTIKMSLVFVQTNARVHIYLYHYNVYKSNTFTKIILVMD